MKLTNEDIFHTFHLYIYKFHRDGIIDNEIRINYGVFDRYCDLIRNNLGNKIKL